MTTVIRDTGTLVLISGHCISRTDHHNPLDIQITYTKLKHSITDLYKKGQFVSFYIFLKPASDYSSQVQES